LDQDAAKQELWTETLKQAMELTENNCLHHDYSQLHPHSMFGLLHFNYISHDRIISDTVLVDMQHHRQSASFSR